MRRLLPLLLLMALAALSACKATKKAYEQGDYESAVFNSIERLRRSPDSKKASQTLEAAYPALLEYYQERINTAKLGSDPLRWETVAEYYETLNRVYNEIQRAPAARRLLPNARNFTSEFNDATLKSAEARYALGMQRLELGRQGDRESAKMAYEHFQRALAFRPGFRDAESKMFEAQDWATLHIQIEPIPMHSRSLQLTNEFFENQIIEYIRSQQFSPFVRFYSAKEAGQLRREPDQIIRMMFDDFVVGQAYVKETVINRQRDSVIVGKATVGDSTVNVYGTVKAEVHRFQKEISSSGLLDYRIIDGRTGSLISNRKFPGTFVYYDRWGFFNGDERALDEDDKRFISKRREAPNPLPQDLFIEFTKPIFSQVTTFTGEFYRNY
ncbi:MAG: hypothetical protein NW241_14500 [Bacteroidia bacterium]|nr:hypothetical protein [Bacteroidia bacterium]